MKESSVQAVWQGVLGQIEMTMPHGHFEAWFKNTELISITDDEATIAVINVFAKAQFQTRFDKQIRDALEKSGYSPKKIKYEVKQSGKKTRVSRETTLVHNSQPETTETTTSPTLSPSPLNRGGLNPRYTFHNFVVGSNNDLAYTASQAVAANPGVKYNPLYLYGGVGLGKTHLIQAIGNDVLAHNPEAKILYVNTETFVKEFVDYLRFKKSGFSKKYREVDVLIVDDMQFIADKEKIQEEFFHTFNHLHQNNKQIIITSDKPPKSIPTLTERLRSRFEMGMMIDVQLPDFETRCAIISTKAAQSGVELANETVEFLATNIKTNVRELEGILNQLLATAEMRGIEPDITTAEGLLGSVRRTRPQHLTPKQIIDRTARHFQLSADDICSSKRDKHIVVPRQIAMYLMRSELHMSFPKIASELGRKDHTTAIHSVEKIDKAMKLDILVREQVSMIRERLYG